ncbi:MAG: hypothetical protein WCR67_00330 [Bacilli bacterium]
MKKTHLIILAFSVIIGGGIGGVGGWFLGSYFKQSAVVTGSFEKDETAYNKFTEVMGTQDVASVDLTSTSLTAADVAGMAFYKFCYLDTSYRSFTSFNQAISETMSVKNVQNTYSAYIKTSNGKGMKENISKAGFVGFAERTYNYDQAKGTGAASPIYTTSSGANAYDYFRLTNKAEITESTNTIEADYLATDVLKYHVSLAAYIKQFSISPEFPFNYIVNSDTVGETKTVKNTSGKDEVYDNSMVLNSNNQYEIKLSLGEDAISSYKKYMFTTTADSDSNIAKMKDVPVFDDVCVRVIVSRDLKLVGMTTIEAYNVVSMVGNVPTKAYGKILFDYSNKDIPSNSSDPIDYSKVSTCTI